MKIPSFAHFLQRSKKRTLYVECKGCGTSVRIRVPTTPTAVIVKRRITMHAWETTETGMYCRQCRKGVPHVLPFF